MGSTDFLLCSNEAFDAPQFSKEAFPNGSPAVAVHTNEKDPSAACLPSQSALLQAGHSSGSFPRDSALMCMHLCHIIQLVLQLTPTWHLNSLTNTLVMPWWHDYCSNWILYAALTQTRLQTCCLLGSADCYVTKHRFTLIQWPHPRLCTTPEYLSDKDRATVVWFDLIFLDFFLLLFLNHGTLILRFPLVQGFQLMILE